MDIRMLVLIPTLCEVRLSEKNELLYGNRESKYPNYKY